MKSRAQLVLVPMAFVVLLGLFLLVERQPSLFANTTYLGVLVALQIAVVALSHFEELFLPLLMGTFIWAGSSLPFSGTGMSLRWLFLAVGALGGFVIWIKRPRMRHFEAFHMVALFCVIFAFVSAIVSEVPRTALMKAVSLFFLFLYASSGVPVTIAGRERKVANGIVLACEILLYVSVLCYFFLSLAIFGNPNSLGAIIGIAVVPVILWGAVTAENRTLMHRRFVALALCAGLLYSANSRASTLCATVVVVVFTIAVRRQRLLLQCAFVVVFFLAVMAIVNPSHMDELISSFTGRVIYKQQGTNNGIFGSRLAPWTETLSVVKRHPWFGSGFGTSELGELRPNSETSSVYTLEGTNREHGNSYLAAAEYLGLLGASPFLILLFMLLRALVQVCRWMRRTGDIYHCCIPFALVVMAGLVHACFEDWLFAVGSYLCVFFWVSVFALIHLNPENRPKISDSASREASPMHQAA